MYEASIENVIVEAIIQIQTHNLFRYTVVVWVHWFIRTEYQSLPLEVYYWFYRQTFSNKQGKGFCLWSVAQMILLSPFHFRDEGSMFMSVWRKRGKKLEAKGKWCSLWAQNASEHKIRWDLTHTYHVCTFAFQKWKIGQNAPKHTMKLMDK